MDNRYHRFRREVVSCLLKRGEQLFKLLLLGGSLALSSCRAIEPRYEVSQLPAPYQGKAPLNHDNVDYHNHLTLKPYYQLIETPVQIVNPRLVLVPTPHYETYPPAQWDPSGRLGYAAWQLNTSQELRYQAYGKFSDFSRYRQSAWPELTGYKAVCTSLYSIEKGLTTNEGSKTLGIINNTGLKRFALKTVTGLDKKRLQNVVHDLTLEPLIETQAEYDFLKHQAQALSAESPQRVVLAEPRTLDSLLQAPNTTAVVISIEGGHVLLGPDALQNNRLLLADTKPQDAQDIRDRVALIKAWQHPVFFITFSHLIWNKLAGQAKGTDADGFKRQLLTILSRMPGFGPAVFTQPNSGIAGLSGASYESGTLPYDNGNSERIIPDDNQLGLVAIEALLSKNNGRRILIDLRHSGIKTRLQFYHLRDSLYQDVPPLVSHCAASGESLRLAIATGLRPYYDRYPEFNNPEKFYRKKIKNHSFRMFNQWPYSKYFSDNTTTLKATEIFRSNSTGWFHPTSNNLADEEIEYITRNGGLMGLTVEQRGLGGSMKQYKKTRRAAQASFRSWLTRNEPTLTDAERLIREKQFFDAVPFMRNLWYFTNLSKPGADVWYHLTIGSDYDGIADPMDSFATSSRLPNLESFINDYYQAFEHVYGLRFNLAGRSMSQNLRLVFSTNGVDFIKKYYPRR
ncbi:hypothetical protein E5K00_14665 [Hymenobacter aquaticus]|uniref:Peptidase M19 n=1 Tax=Hymenobacter aquaticus TaxID=1867101 RepID=A0A4Z0PVK7_9BACT|nr:hypothetical protein [Hymenobacter aquaticus]TGE21525.1 hypothetical protein E5K00_14665 [Hymenobacter aquaticus]